MEEILQTFVEVLFSNETIQKAQNLRDSENDRIAIDKNGIPFRLQKARTGNINLEVFFQDQKIRIYEFNILGKVSKI